MSGDQYTWSGPASGSWGSVVNWTDTTTGQDPAPKSPGVHDDVTIPSAGRLNGVPITQVIKGTGSSASLTIQGLASLNGAFQTGTLAIAGTALNGSLLSVTGGTLAVAHNVTEGLGLGGRLDANGGAVTIGGTTTANLSVENGGTEQVGGSSETGLGLTVWDSTSSIEFGTAGGVQAGSIQVDAGVSLHQVGGDAPTIVNHGSIDGGGFFATNVVNTGTISGANFAAPAGSALTFTNSGTITLIGNSIGGSLMNSDVLLAERGGNVIGDVTGGGQIHIGDSSNLTTGQVSSGQLMWFEGPGASLTIGASSLDSSKVYDAAITGFAAS